MKENTAKNLPELEDPIVIPDGANLTPDQIVAELDKYIIAQEEAKRAVAIAMRNRWRRLRVPNQMREEITPKNIIMIGPTGVGKTEISRRLAKLANAPFVKVEASKFTEVGYVGRDVESIIRDLAEVAHSLVREEEKEKVRQKAENIAEEKLLDFLLPTFEGVRSEDSESVDEGLSPREKMRKVLRAGKIEDKIVEIEAHKQSGAQLEILGPPGMGAMEEQLKDLFTNMAPKSKEKRKLPVSDARRILIRESQDDLINPEHVVKEAVNRAQSTGIVFIDEIDKICGTGGSGKGPDVSREGVQRDLLPLVEGCTVSTKYGPVKTDHILFVASGAFHYSKPSDLMPEFQGRFPIRVELKSLTASHFVKILSEPENALTKQYVALLKTEGVELVFTKDAIEEIAKLTAEVNSKTENIGARRLHTLLEKVLEELSFSAHEISGGRVEINKNYVQKRVADIVQDTDLSRFIL